MNRNARGYERLLQRITARSHKEPNVRAAVIIGSRARANHPADEWSDLDVLLFVRDPERYIRSAEWVEAGPDLLEFRIEAPSFMRNQVRILVGTMLEVGQGRRSVEDFKELFTGRPRTAAGETAPPHGLYLVRVRYDAP